MPDQLSCTANSVIGHPDTTLSASQLDKGQTVKTRLSCQYFQWFSDATIGFDSTQCDLYFDI